MSNAEPPVRTPAGPSLGGFGRLGPTLTDVRHTRGLVNAVMPSAYLEQLNGSLAVHAADCRLVALYFFAQLDDAPDRSGAIHRAFGRQRRELAQAGVAIAGVSGDPLDALPGTVVANRLAYPLLADSRLLIADELGLPTFGDGSARHYEHVVLLTTAPHPGVIRKSFTLSQTWRRCLAGFSHGAPSTNERSRSRKPWSAPFVV